MDVIVDRCAGVDVGKKQVQVCVRGPDGAGGRRSEVRTFETFTGDLEVLARWLGGEGVTRVAMEATGPYWWPVWHVLEEAGFELLLVNSRHVKILPGRKTDVGDAAWLAELLEHGLLRGSFVPPERVRRLRDLTRYRKKLTQTHTAECQRIQKNLENAGIKLDSVASDVLGVSGRAMLRALLAGERDPEALADLAKGTLRRKIPELQRALHGRFADHHAALIGIILDHIEHLETAIAALDTQIDALVDEPDTEEGSSIPFARARDRLDTIPGVAKRAAEVIIAEIGTDMSRFPTAGHLASWAGMCPGNNITGGRNRGGRTTKGNVWLRDVLVQCAWSAARTRDTYLAAQFWRLARRIGKKKAAMAVGHSILVAAWHILTDDIDYADLGADWFARNVNDDHRRDQAIRNLHDLGYRVTLEKVACRAVRDHDGAVGKRFDQVVEPCDRIVSGLPPLPIVATQERDHRQLVISDNPVPPRADLARLANDAHLADAEVVGRLDRHASSLATSRDGRSSTAGTCSRARTASSRPSSARRHSAGV